MDRIDLADKTPRSSASLHTDRRRSGSTGHRRAALSGVILGMAVLAAHSDSRVGAEVALPPGDASSGSSPAFARMTLEQAIDVAREDFLGPRPKVTAVALLSSTPEVALFAVVAPGHAVWEITAISASTACLDDGATGPGMQCLEAGSAHVFIEDSTGRFIAADIVSPSSTR
jgi:hypothetical protein